MKITQTRNTITASLDNIQANLKTVPRKAYEYWRSITPVRSGNARRKTSLSGNRILANYPYAVPLDRGWSRQAPQGMSRPTETYLRQLIRRTLRK